MKKTIFIIALLCNISITFSQWNQESNLMYTTKKVGIGVTSPTEQLEILGNIKLIGTRPNRYTSYSKFTMLNGFIESNAVSAPGSAYSKMLIHMSSGEILSNYGSGGINFLRIKANNILDLQGRKIILTGGKTGIGTDNPKELLQVGNASSSPLTFHDGGHKAISWNAYYNGGWKKHNPNNAASKIEFSPQGNFLTIDIANADGTTETNWRNTELLIKEGFISTGNATLLIGNEQSLQNPNGNWRNEYKLAVDGSVLCEKVRCQMSENWADYVFEKDYQLTPIQEVKSFIEKNKHLPNVPSAVELKNEGLDLAEMQRVQMEKIEELMLYIIQLKEESEVLKANTTHQIKELKQENHELRTLIIK